MKKAVAVVLCLLLALGAALPALAGEEAAAPAQEAAQGQGETGGVKPISPGEFAEKLQLLGEKLYGAASPVTDVVAKLTLAAAGLLLVFFLVWRGVVRRAIGAVLAVAAGLVLWYAAPYIVGVVKYLAAWLTS